jgi:hypothetical protein
VVAVPHGQCVTRTPRVARLILRPLGLPWSNAHLGCGMVRRGSGGLSSPPAGVRVPRLREGVLATGDIPA